MFANKPLTQTDMYTYISIFCTTCALYMKQVLSVIWEKQTNCLTQSQDSTWTGCKVTQKWHTPHFFESEVNQMLSRWHCLVHENLHVFFCIHNFISFNKIHNWLKCGCKPLQSLHRVLQMAINTVVPFTWPPLYILGVTWTKNAQIWIYHFLFFCISVFSDRLLDITLRCK